MTPIDDCALTLTPDDPPTGDALAVIVDPVQQPDVEDVDLGMCHPRQPTLPSFDDVHLLTRTVVFQGHGFVERILCYNLHIGD